VDPVPQLAKVLREYGEERFASRIAAAIARRRATAPLLRSSELVELLYEVVPAASRRTGGHPAKRTFQALRIEVNGELDALRGALPAAVDALGLGGRIVVLAYHSLEDRMVKRELAARAASRTPVDLPVELPGHGPELRLLTRGAEQASPEEISDNPRAAPVRLRAAERIREAA
jgi:16S rRNA (cytosine1402-N4)-methyltransferase